MLPESIGAVIAFLLLIAPGYIWDRQSARHEPELRTTTLREAATIVFSSIIPSTIAGTALLPLWLSLPRTDTPPLPMLAVGLATSALACVLTYGWAWLRFRSRRASGGEITRGSTLFKALVALPRGKERISEVVVTARLQDGTLWRGVHASHDVGPDESAPMLLLQPPLVRRDPGATELVRYQAHEYVVLPLEGISSLQLTYLTGATPPASGPRPSMPAG